MQNSIYIKAGSIIVMSIILAFALYLHDGQRQILKDENGQEALTRNENGEGKRSEELIVQIGQEKEDIIVDVGEQAYTKEEIQKIFAESEENLEELMLAENSSPDEVRHDLNLAEKIPGTTIQISWELDNYEVINIQGELQEEKLTEEGTLVKLQALLTCEEESVVYEFYVCVYPPETTHLDKMIRKLKEAIRETEENTRQDNWLVLPEQVDGIPVKWSYPGNTRAVGIAVLGSVAAGLIYAAERQKKKEEEKKREQQMFLDYPQLIGKFTLFLGAGMTPRKAWFKIAEEYLNQRQDIGIRFAYEEMVFTMHEIQGGTSEGVSYEQFGRRCGITQYRKFGALLSQNLRKGTKGLAILLKEEADNAFEERKSLAKKLGEEAGTKLLGPMFLMLGIVLIIIVIPAFLTIQI